MPFVAEEVILREDSRTLSPETKTPAELAEIVVEFAATKGWMERVRLGADRRWYERVYRGPEHDVWVISWMPGQSTGFHDHGESAGAFVVTTGVLEEQRVGEAARAVAAGKALAFGADYLHDVRNASEAPAISIHAYSPPLDEMNEYEVEGTELIPREREARTVVERTEGQSVEEMLGSARARLQRMSAKEAYAAAKAGAVLVDIRPEAQRAVEGSIEGALVVERNVLEWRFDPASSARLPVATDHGVQVIVFCSEGYTSSLAAAALQELGLWRATDVEGGFQAWRAAGLPVVDPEG